MSEIIIKFQIQANKERENKFAHLNSTSIFEIGK